MCLTKNIPISIDFITHADAEEHMYCLSGKQGVPAAWPNPA